MFRFQFQYGEDGLDVLKTQFLNKSRFSFLIQNEETFVSGEELKSRLAKLDMKTASSMWKKVRIGYFIRCKSGLGGCSQFVCAPFIDRVWLQEPFLL